MKTNTTYYSKNNLLQSLSWSLPLLFFALSISLNAQTSSTTDAKGYKSVDYTKLTPLLIEAIQSQQEQIEAQEARLMRIEKQLGINK